MVDMFGNMPASLALKHFLDNKGTNYDFNNDWGILNTYRGKENLAENTNSLIQVVEESVKSKSTVSFATNTELLGTNYSEHLEDLADIGWWYVSWTIWQSGWRASMLARPRSSRQWQVSWSCSS